MATWWRTLRNRPLRTRLTAVLVVSAFSGVVAAGALAQSGSKLIGKLEGPEVVTDASKFPKTFKEAPQLAALVKAGKLPPVAERIGQDPLVIKPLKEIGKYGGAMRAGFTGPADFWNGFRCCSGPDHLMFWDYTGDKAVPNLAKGLEMQDNGRAWLVHLRRGMKWSDGKPFTADDFVFWFEDIYRNKDLVPTPTAVMAINGKQGVIEKVDTYTVRFKFPESYFMFPDVLAGSTDLAGQWVAYRGMGGFAPAHYLKQFHPKYVSADELDKRAKEAKFDSWVRMFLAKNDWALNPDLPVLSPWKTVTPINTPTWTLERNPYSVFVDTAGNQLPYIDKVVLTLAENLEVLNLRAIAGEYDYASRHVDLGKLPVFLENQQRGNYKVYLDPGDYCDLIIKFNLNYDADPEIAKWLNTADFRRALSLGINRDQINETFWLGTGTPGSVVPVDSNKYNPGPQYRKLWATLDMKKANEMLDKIGLAKKDARGLPAPQRRQGPAAHRDHDARRPVRAVHADLRDDPRAVEEDRHRPPGPGGRAQPRHQARRRQRAAALRLEQRRQRAPLHLPDPRVPLRRRRRRLLRAALREVVPLRRHAGQGARAADEGADGQVEEGVRRAGEGTRSSSARTSGRSPPRRSSSSAWSARARRPWACAW